MEKSTIFTLWTSFVGVTPHRVTQWAPVIFCLMNSYLNWMEQRSILMLWTSFVGVTPHRVTPRAPINFFVKLNSYLNWILRGSLLWRKAQFSLFEPLCCYFVGVTPHRVTPRLQFFCKMNLYLNWIFKGGHCYARKLNFEYLNLIWQGHPFLGSSMDLPWLFQTFFSPYSFCVDATIFLWWSAFWFKR